VTIGFSDNIVRPWVQSSQTQLHPLLTVLGIFGGLELFGPPGIVLGPIVAAMAFWTVAAYAELREKSS
jgi:predicted PurR-regulated permease PerM